MKILIVEDDVVLSELLREYLQQLDHERVRVCFNGQEAEAAVQEESFDCAFVDLRLPDMDGLRLLDSIKREDPSLPIVMMSGYPTMGSTIEAMRKGASDFLTKPFTLQDMALALERVTKERRLLLENLSLQLEIQARNQLELVNKELQDKIHEQGQLFGISRELDEVRSSEDLYPRIVEVASRVTSSKQIGFFIMPPEQNSLMLVSEHGLDRLHDGRRLVQVRGEQLKEALNRESPVRINLSDLFGGTDSETWLRNSSRLSCWPLHIRGELFGFLAAAANGEEKVFSQTEIKLLDFLVKKAALTIENMALYESMIGNFYGILKSLVNALEAKDLYTGKHSERVTRYALRIAQRLGCSPAQIEALQTVGYLHDIGKIGIADSILNKPTVLTSQEYELVKKHPVIGDSIVSELGLSPEERGIIRHHHERWDGTGYPDGLAREEIPHLARIVMVADAFDAMTSKRAYRDAMSPKDALQELQRNKGKQFDADVVDAFREAGSACDAE
ncbi:MAG TPA: response regulator [Syntrophobacteraceae bacterium]|nr:response regulator [Syntrophobacteraceae bacterium]